MLYQHLPTLYGGGGRVVLDSLPRRRRPSSSTTCFPRAVPKTHQFRRMRLSGRLRMNAGFLRDFPASRPRLKHRLGEMSERSFSLLLQAQSRPSSPYAGLFGMKTARILGLRTGGRTNGKINPVMTTIFRASPFNAGSTAIAT